MDVSIVIPCSTDVAGLEETLESIFTQGWDASRFEVIVCNDGASEAVAAVARNYACREARLDTNRGSYAARNAGVHASVAPSLAFIDADVHVSSAWLDAGLEALNEADYAGGRVFVDPGEPASFWKRTDASFAFPVQEYMQKLHFAPTANLFVRRKVFQDLGGFEEGLKSGGDREFGLRVYKRGLTQVYSDLAEVRHPARGFIQQMRKALRTAAGSADLEVVLFGKSGFDLARSSARFSLGKVGRSFWSAGKFLIRGGGEPRKESSLQTSGRLLIEAWYFACLSWFAVWRSLRKDAFVSSVPRIGPVTPPRQG